MQAGCFASATRHWASYGKFYVGPGNGLVQAIVRTFMFNGAREPTAAGCTGEQPASRAFPLGILRSTSTVRDIRLKTRGRAMGKIPSSSLVEKPARRNLKMAAR